MGDALTKLFDLYRPPLILVLEHRAEPRVRSLLLLDQAPLYPIHRRKLPVELELQAPMPLAPLAPGSLPEATRLLDNRNVDRLQDFGHDHILDDHPWHAYALIAT